MEIIFLLPVSLICISFGLLLFFKPLFAIEFQKKFYALINWRMEPIDLSKEIRNTKIMGFFLAAFVLAVDVFALLRFFCHK